MDNDHAQVNGHSAHAIEAPTRFRFKSPFLNTKQAGAYIGLSGRTLEKMRCNGAGPEFRKHGRYVRYHIDALDAWSAAHTQQSTSNS